LTNAIARDAPGVDGAIRTLAAVAPDQALPLLLSRLQSSDTRARLNAFSLLSHYPLTPEIKSAMQTAATGSDSILAERAKILLTDDNQKVHPQEGRFLDDPGYEGKRLGEWLKMRNPDGQFSSAATNAIHHLGTNAIPALLRRLTYAKPPFRQPAWEINMDAVYGFITLGEQAVPALPKLSALMEGTNQNWVRYAMVSSLGTGTNAIPILCQGLTNGFAGVRGEAADALTEAIAIRFPDRRNEIIPRLKKLLNDPDPDVRQNVTGNLLKLNDTNTASTQIK
jgi:HEAT repeat protein